MFGAGHMQDMVFKVRENLSRLPSKQPKFKEGRRPKFMEGRRPKYPYKQNGQKLKDKVISENELAEVISKIRHDAQEEKRERRLKFSLTILIAILILIVILFLFGLLLEWYWSVGKDLLRVR